MLSQGPAICGYQHVTIFHDLGVKFGLQNVDTCEGDKLQDFVLPLHCDRQRHDDQDWEASIFTLRLFDEVLECDNRLYGFACGGIGQAAAKSRNVRRPGTYDDQEIMQKSMWSSAGMVGSFLLSPAAVLITKRKATCYQKSDHHCNSTVYATIQ